MGLGRIGAHGIGLLEMNMDSYGAQWMMKFLKSRTNPDESRTSIGQIGRLKLSGQIVIRLEPKSGLPPAYLREATYMRYGAQTWRTEAGTNDFQNISPDQSSENNFTLVPQETNTATVTISSYLTSYSKLLSTPEGLLPLPSGTHQLSQLPVVELSENKYGAVKAAGPGLMIFDAHFGPGKTMDTPPEASTNPFQVPTNEIPALDQVIEEIHAAGLSDNRKLLAVQQFFNSKFTYSTWQGPDKLIRTNNETPISRFLLYSRSGHCEYFATATVLLLRQLHIPARYAVGYAVHEARGNGYVVRERDAHAWCLVWDSTQKTWEDFDTTPGSWVEVEGERASSWERISDFFSWFKFELAKLRWGQTAWRQYALWALVPMIGFLLYKIIFRRGRQRAKVKNNGTDDSLNYWPGLDSEFYRLENRLAARGVPRQSGETLSDWLNRALTDPALADLRQPMNELLLLHYRYRFDPAGLDAAGRMKLRHRTSECLAALTPIEPKNKRDSMT
jgi:transglutaminase-like putative cysteine protease